MNRRRPALSVCTCAAYPFPHRPCSGKCDEFSILETVWKRHTRCPDCYYRDVNPGAADEPPSSECRLIAELGDFNLCPGLSDILKPRSKS